MIRVAGGAGDRRKGTEQTAKADTHALKAGDVVGGPGGREDDDEEGRGDQPVEVEHQEHVVIQPLLLELISEVFV